MDEPNLRREHRKSLENRINQGTYSLPAPELATFDLFCSAINRHKEIIAEDHQKKDILLQQIMAEDRKRTILSVYESIMTGAIQVKGVNPEAVLQNLNDIITRPILADHKYRLRESDFKTEDDIEEDHVGYIIILGFNPNNPNHTASIGKEIYHGQSEIITPELKISGKITESEVRTNLLSLAYRDGADLFAPDGTYIDGRTVLEGIKLKDVPSLRQRFPEITNWPNEINTLTEHGMHPKAGTRNSNTIAYSWHHPDIIAHTLSHTGGYSARRIQSGLVTWSTNQTEDTIAKYLVKNKKEAFQFPQHI